MENKFFYTFLNKASEDFEKILQYIPAELANPSAAKKLIEEFLKEFDRLCSFPFSCPIVDNMFFEEKIVRKLVVVNYIALYRVVGNEIQIIRIRHSTSNYLI